MEAPREKLVLGRGLFDVQLQTSLLAWTLA